MDGVKIYGLCLERLKHQIVAAKKRLGGNFTGKGCVLLESYNTGVIDDIVDILELYDLEDKTPEPLREKLDDLAYTVSILLGETLTFAHTGEGHLGLYLALQLPSQALPGQEVGINVPALSIA